MIMQKVRCKRGHLLDEENVYVIKEFYRTKRECRICRKNRERKYWLKKKLSFLSLEISFYNEELKKEWSRYVHIELCKREEYRDILKAELAELEKTH